jgi:hypothetical protein
VPTGLAAAVAGAGTVELAWDAIRFLDGAGGYQITWSLSPTGSEQPAGQTKYKTDETFRVSGLAPGRYYYFRLRCFTQPHLDNDNTVYGDKCKPRAVFVPAPY